MKPVFTPEARLGHEGHEANLWATLPRSSNSLAEKEVKSTLFEPEATEAATVDASVSVLASLAHVTARTTSAPNGP
jgi:hypothetical protein